MLPKGKKNHGMLFSILILLFIPSSVGIRNNVNSINQGELKGGTNEVIEDSDQKVE